MSRPTESIRFKYRTFRFQQLQTIDQRHKIHCRLGLDTTQTITKDDIQNCTCFNNETCDSASWSYWSKCDGNCKQTRKRNNGSDEETESRECRELCFFDVKDVIDEDLKTCSIFKNRSKRDISLNSRLLKKSRLFGGSSVFPGSLPYVVRLTFQSFDQFHSDAQDGVLPHSPHSLCDIRYRLYHMDHMIWSIIWNRL